MSDVKPSLTYRKVYETSNELSSYYRSLDMKVGSAEVQSFERARTSWVLEERGATSNESPVEEEVTLPIKGFNDRLCFSSKILSWRREWDLFYGCPTVVLAHRLFDQTVS